MKKILGIIIIAIIFVLLAVFSGIIPAFTLLDNGTNTISRNIGGFTGNPNQELIGPNSRKGFITSYMENGLSETITAQGTFHIDTLAGGDCKTMAYVVYLKKNTYSSYEIVSDAGVKGEPFTSKYITNPNPGSASDPAVLGPGSHALLPYSFEIVGDDYSNGAIKIELYGWIDESVFNPLDGGYRWRKLASDEAYLFEGWGGLYLPKDEDGNPKSTFEIGETAEIRVKTSYGGQAVDEGKTWRVVLRYPSDQGGEIYKQEDYGDNVDTTFTFTVTSSMYSSSSNNRYTLEIFNTLIPKGTLSVNTIDVIGKAPSDVVFVSPPTQVKINSECSITMQATINDDTQLDIDHFEVSVIYGTSGVLLPSDPNSKNWIIHTTDIPASGSGNTFTATIKFIPAKESYVTIHAKAYDNEGRASKHTMYCTLWVYKDVPVPDEVIDEETGSGYYGGGHTDTWYPWDPSGGNWGDVVIPFSLEGLIVSILIVLAFAILGFFVFKSNPYYLVGIIILGVIIAVIVYFVFFTDVFSAWISIG